MGAPLAASPVEAPGTPHRDAATDEHESPFGITPVKFAMWIFLASEVMFFTGLLGSYVILRFNNPAVFHEDAKHLNWILAAANTLILIGSSYTMALAVLNAQKKNWKTSSRFLLITMLMGATFLVVKAFEYTGKIQHGILPKTSIFFACYFVLTGCHALHILAGLIPMGITWRRAAAGRTTGAGVELLGLYWHFVDLVWIFLFPLLYLL